MQGNINTNPFIALSGLIGAGKSTIAKSIAKILNTPCYCEESFLDPELMKSFYDSPKDHSFLLETSLLVKRLVQQLKIVHGCEGGIQDRTLYEDMIFSKMLLNSERMKPSEFKIYSEMFQQVIKLVPPPHVIVHLDITPEESLHRIRERGRPYEENITIEYLRSLHKEYEEFIPTLKHVPVIRVPWHKYGNPEQLAHAIVEKYVSLSHIHSIDLNEQSLI